MSSDLSNLNSIVEDLQEQVLNHEGVQKELQDQIETLKSELKELAKAYQQPEISSEPGQGLVQMFTSLVKCVKDETGNSGYVSIQLDVTQYSHGEWSTEYKMYSSDGGWTKPHKSAVDAAAEMTAKLKELS